MICYHYKLNYMRLQLIVNPKIKMPPSNPNPNIHFYSCLCANVVLLAVSFDHTMSMCKGKMLSMLFDKSWQVTKQDATNQIKK